MNAILGSKCQIFVSDFNDFGISRQILIYATNMKHHENPSSASPADKRGQTDRWTDRHDEASRRFSRLYAKSAKENHIISA